MVYKKRFSQIYFQSQVQTHAKLIKIEKRD